ncbi:MAG: hypothetical protein M5Z89_18985, partial [Olivibacter sp.]|nr:hypothetical protein [Olivibacter sp. UJ_SKK_5.1]
VYIRTQNTGMEIFTTKNGDRNLGSIYSYSKGYVIFLPSFNFGHEDFAEYNEKEDEETWTKEALKKGNILINFLIETTKMLNTSSQKTPKPNWLNDASFELEQSLHTKQEIQKIEKEIEEKKKLLTNLNSVLEEKEILKDLLYETGKPLEKAVIKALKILGFSAENYDDGQLELDQIILSPEGKRFIGECEGKDNKDIDVTKFRQLLDGLNADFERDDVAEKAYGLLLGNSQRLTNPNERTLDFTQKCQNGAKREKIGLIKTTDLFTICKVIEETKDLEFAKKCREAIYRQMGEIIKFPAYKSPISKRV